MKHLTPKTLPVSCNRDCGAGCPLLAHIDNGRISALTDNPLKDPYLKGCLRGYQMPATVYAESRLKKPLLRTGRRGDGIFREIPWSEAIARITEKLDHLRGRHDLESILAFNGSGSCRGAVHHTGNLSKRFFALLGGFVRPADTYSSAAAAFAEKHLFGTRDLGFDAPTLAHTELIILWGANLCETRFGCQLESWVKKAKDRGIPVIVIDPRRTATVRKLATRWIPLHPGTDTVLMAAVLQVLIDRRLVDRHFVATCTHGFDELAAYLTGRNGGVVKDPGWAEKICGVPAEEIVRLAIDYGQAKPAALLPGLSIQRTLGGEETFRFSTALQAATGNIGIPGGSSGAEFWNRLPVPYFPSLSPPDLSSFPTINVYQWADAVLEGRPGGWPSDIRLIYNAGTNYLNQGSDIKKNKRAFEKAGFVVTHDCFLTPTALFSDIVLPATTFLERKDVVFPSDNYLFYSERAIEPRYEARNDYDIFWKLAEHLGFGQAFSQGRTADQWLEKLLHESAVTDIDQFITTGIYKGKEQGRVALSEFVADPSGRPLPTPSGKIEIKSQTYAQCGGPAIPQCRIALPETDYPLRLITPHAGCRVNSQNANLSWTRLFDLQSLEMNHADGIARGLHSGDPVRMSSEIGALKVKVKLTNRIIPGTVCLYQGAWTRMDVHGNEIGGAVNTLTSTTPTLPSRGARTHSIFVQVERAK